MRVHQAPLFLGCMVLLIALAACGGTAEEAARQVSSPLPPAPTEIKSPPHTETPQADGPDLTAIDPFLIPLLHALTQTPPDYAVLQGSMGREFLFFDRFGVESYPPAEAIAQLKANDLPPSAAVTYDLDAAPDPAAIAPFPEAEKFIQSTGWGEDGSYIGVLVITRVEEGFEWTGVYVVPDPALAASLEAAPPVRIEFAPGATSETLSGDLPANQIHEYVAYAFEGQIMEVSIVSPSNQVYLTISGLSDGLPLVRSASDATWWRGMLPATQDYSIKAVSGGQPDSYSLEVTIVTDEAALGGWVPLPAGVCEDLEAAVAAELGAGDIWLETNAPFEDFVSGTYGRGCLVTVTGTGADFSRFDDVFTRLSDMLAAMGWLLDLQYAADGPTGTHGGFWKDDGLMLVSSGWEPVADANCPRDQPITLCDLAPEQQLYTITLSAAMR